MTAAARPFISAEVITAALTCRLRFWRGGPAVPVKDTIKIADKSGRVVETPDRAALYAEQTPRCFQRTLYLQALDASPAKKRALSPTIAACLSWRACRLR